MKIFISVDMEGIAGVVNWNHVSLEGIEYEKAREWMTAEANAAIEGAFEAGATEVVVADAHGLFCNLLPDKLHEDAFLMRGSPRPLSMMEGIDETFDAIFFVGYHAMAGNAKGILAHTYSSRLIYALHLNGITVGESAFNAGIAAEFGVPVALVCGDDMLEAEVSEFLPSAERVITKWALSPFSARNLSPKASQKKIKAGAKRAIQRLSEMKAQQFEKPIRLEVDFMKPYAAFVGENIPGVERIGGRRLAYTGTDMLEIIRVFRLMLNASLDEKFV